MIQLYIYIFFIFFSIMNYWKKWKVLVTHRVWLFVTPWTVVCQAPLSMEFSRQEYWSGLPFPSPGESSQTRDGTWVSCIAGRFFTIWVTREARLTLCKHYVLALGSSGRKQVLLFKCRTRRQTASQGLCLKCSQDASHERWMLTLWRAACLRLRRASQGSIE